MPKIKDTVPIQVTRTNRTTQLRIALNEDESINNVIAERWQFTTEAGVQVLAPIYVGTFSLDGPTEISTAIANKITDLLERIDAKDTPREVEVEVEVEGKVK